MLSSIRTAFGVDHKGPSKCSADAIVNDAKACLSPLVHKVTICDRPFKNQAGLVQYRYDEHRSAVRSRRVETARQFDVSLSDAPFHRDFVIALAAKIEESENMPGQCAEMASLAAAKLKAVAAEHKVRVYTVQLPDINHTITLLSSNHYRAQEWVNWRDEFKASSAIVDLWEGALRSDDSSALVDLARSNGYTKSEPRALIQCMVWDEFSSNDRA